MQECSCLMDLEGPDSTNINYYFSILLIFLGAFIIKGIIGFSPFWQNGAFFQLTWPSKYLSDFNAYQVDFFAMLRKFSNMNFSKFFEPFWSY